MTTAALVLRANQPLLINDCRCFVAAATSMARSMGGHLAVVVAQLMLAAAWLAKAADSL